MHEVVDGFFQALAQQVVVNALAQWGGVHKAHIVFGKRAFGQGQQLHAVSVRVQAHGRMHGAHKAVEKSAVNAPVLKQLAHIFQRVHRVLHRLRRKAVHQVSVHQHPCIGKALGHLRHLLNRDPFFHQVQQAV